MVEGSIPSAPAKLNFILMISYIKETIAELKKLSLPAKKEVYITTGTIFVVVAIFALAITFSDFVISRVVGLIFGL